MSKYLLSRKAVDVYTIEWEKLHSKSEQTESLTRYIAKKQAIYLLDILIKEGWDEQKAKEELQKILGNKVLGSR